MSCSFINIPSAAIDDLSQQVDILIVTATAVETEGLHCRLCPLPGREGLLRIYSGRQTYFIGALGSFAVVHVQCGMGAVGRASAITTSLESIDAWRPKAVVMIGIAFGVDDKQKIGDVLISELLLPYDNKRVGKGKTLFRGARPEAGQILLNRFKNTTGWRYSTLDGDANRYFCPILSGESLVDNKEFRDYLCAEFPTAKGGEMEGAGLVAAAENRKLEWLLVKGICDFADGEKSVNKEEYQNIAIDSAASLCEFVFSNKYVFDDLGIKPIDSETDRIQRDEIISEMLIPLYTTSSEKYYLPREIDSDVQNIIKLYGMWISGPCGSGKTNMVIRNLYFLDHEFIFFDLSVCTGKKGVSFFRSFYGVVRQVLSGDSTYRAKIDTKDIIDGMAEIISSKLGGQSIVLYFDEIPISLESDFEEFIEMILAVHIRLNNINPKTMTKFILSTISNPFGQIKTYQKKINEKIKFVHLSDWDVKDQISLFDVLAHGLQLPFSPEERNLVLARGNATPRYIKNFFKNRVIQPRWSLESVIIETQREV